MIRFARFCLLMAVAGLAMLAALTWATFAWDMLVAPAHAYSCAEIKAAVAKYGKAVVRQQAKSRGLTDQEIDAEQQRCGIR